MLIRGIIPAQKVIEFSGGDCILLLFIMNEGNLIFRSADRVNMEGILFYDSLIILNGLLISVSIGGFLPLLDQLLGT